MPFLSKKRKYEEDGPNKKFELKGEPKKILRIYHSDLHPKSDFVWLSCAPTHPLINAITEATEAKGMTCKWFMQVKSKKATIENLYHNIRKGDTFASLSNIIVAPTGPYDCDVFLHKIGQDVQVPQKKKEAKRPDGPPPPQPGQAEPAGAPMLDSVHAAPSNVIGNEPQLARSFNSAFLEH